MAYKTTLKDSTSGTIVYPQTLIDLVQDSDGNSVETLINNKQSKVMVNGILKGDGTGTISSIAVATFIEIGDIDDIVTVQSADEVSY